MKSNWTNFIEQVTGPSGKSHHALDPCSLDRIEFVRIELGQLPKSLTDMLLRFNGAELFMKDGPLLTLFGISTIPPMSDLVWAPDWYIDKFTPVWRSSRKSGGDWVIGMFNYGGLVVLDQNEMVRDWDTSQKKWRPKTWTLHEWADVMLREGEDYLKDQ